MKLKMLKHFSSLEDFNQFDCLYSPLTYQKFIIHKFLKFFNSNIATWYITINVCLELLDCL